MSERGVTILELLIALALGSVILLAGSALYRAVAVSYSLNDAQAYLQDQAALVVGELTRQVEAASLIAVTNGVDSVPLTCPNGEANTLYVFQSNGSVYCFYSSNGQFMQYRAPAGGGTGAWNMLSGSPQPLQLTALDLCGSPPYTTCQTTSDIAYVTFQLQAVGQFGGAATAPTMAFSAAIARRN